MNTGEPAGKRQRPIRARSTTRASRRGGQQSQSRARSASSKPACPAAFSHKSPRPGVDRPYGQRQTATLRAPFSCPEVEKSEAHSAGRTLSLVIAQVSSAQPCVFGFGPLCSRPSLAAPDGYGRLPGTPARPIEDGPAGTPAIWRNRSGASRQLRSWRAASKLRLPGFEQPTRPDRHRRGSSYGPMPAVVCPGAGDYAGGCGTASGFSFFLRLACGPA